METESAKLRKKKSWVFDVLVKSEEG